MACLLLIGSSQVFAVDAAFPEESIDGSGQSAETSMENVNNPEVDIKPDQERANPEDSSVVDSEIEVQKPLDLTFKPEFPENPVPYGQEGYSGANEMSDLFSKNKPDSSLKFSGELLKAEQEEQGKVRPVDGAGIRIELNPK